MAADRLSGAAGHQPLAPPPGHGSALCRSALRRRRAPEPRPSLPFLACAGGMAERALASLDAAEARGYVRDRIGALEVRGRLLRALGRHAEARALYRRASQPAS